MRISFIPECVVLSFISVMADIVCCGSFSTCSAAWYAPAWQYRQQITVANTITDAALTNFPALISTSNGSNPLFTAAQADGDDLLVTAADGVTKLAHEIERYNPASGQQQLQLWVKVPSLSATSNTLLYLYYGNASCASQQQATAVWDSNFQMVQHLEETSGTVTDSTANANNGTAENGLNQNSTGIVDGAARWDGVNDSIVFPHSESLAVTQLTMECWIYRTFTCSGSINECMIINKELDYELAIRFNNILSWGINTTSISWYWQDFGTITPINTWFHAAVTYDGSNVRSYVNGQLVLTTGYAGAITTRANCLRLSHRNGCAYNYLSPFPGGLDEIRISNTARSTAWITATYRTAGAPGTYLTFGAQETPPTPTPTVTASPTLTPSPMPTLTPTATLSPSPSPTLTPTITFSPTLSPTMTPTATVSPTRTPTATPSPLPTATFTPEPSATPILCPHQGDVNLDGGLTPGDAQLAFTYYMNCWAEAPTEEQYCNADFCGDGPIGYCDNSVTPADAQGIMRAYLGYTEPCE